MQYLLYHNSNDPSIELMTLGRQELVVYTQPLLKPNAHAGNLENRVREVMPSLAGIIAQGMRQKGYSQSQLSVASGLSQGMISNVLRSSHGVVRVDNLQKLGMGLEINFDELANALIRTIRVRQEKLEANAMLREVRDAVLEKLEIEPYDKGYMAMVEEYVAYLNGLVADGGFVILGGKCVPPNRVIAGYFLDAKEANNPDHVRLSYEPLAAKEREMAKRLVAEKHGGVVVFHNDFFRNRRRT